MVPTVDGGFQSKDNEPLAMFHGNQTELTGKETKVITVIEKMLPEFARACRAHDPPVVIMHADAWAADDQEEEYRLMGLAIKYAGICGQPVRVIATKQADR